MWKHFAAAATGAAKNKQVHMRSLSLSARRYDIFRPQLAKRNQEVQWPNTQPMMIISFIPERRNVSMAKSMTGRSCRVNNVLLVCSVNGKSRVPKPPANRTPLISINLSHDGYLMDFRPGLVNECGF